MAKKLLLADDSITIQKVVELILSDEDVEITSVGDGAEALEVIEGFMPDIVLADVEMPNLNGYELCKKIKENEKISHIPVILLVGAFEPINEKRAKDAGAEDFLIKPFESQEFLNKINTVMRNAEAKKPAKSNDGEHSDEEPIELGMESLMDEAENDEEETSNSDKLEQGGVDISQDDLDAVMRSIGAKDSASDDEQEADNIDDLTTKELQNVVASLSDNAVSRSKGNLDEMQETIIMGESVQVNTGDNDTFNQLTQETSILEGAIKENDDSALEEEPSSDVSISTNELKDVMEHIAEHESEEGAELTSFVSYTEMDHSKTDKKSTSVEETAIFEEEDNLMNIVEAFKAEKDASMEITSESKDLFKDLEKMGIKSSDKAEDEVINKKEKHHKQKETYHKDDRKSEKNSLLRDLAPRGDVLLTSSDVLVILERSLDGKINELLKDDLIVNTFKDAVSIYVNENIGEIKSFNDIDKDITEMVNDAINHQIKKVLSQINIEGIINQVISSTIQGIITNLAKDVFSASKELLETNIRVVFEEQFPSIKDEIERAISDTLPNIAERLVQREIDEIKAEFM
ncbi:Signal transduction response regulator, receiver region domain protein [Candidatus Magnetoovum chiemensis]|nr:Signal transduction response regulator, receiver region domain protein [Candidatus Magnetoovum chiemensis]